MTPFVKWTLIIGTPAIIILALIDLHII